VCSRGGVVTGTLPPGLSGLGLACVWETDTATRTPINRPAPAAMAIARFVVPFISVRETGELIVQKSADSGAWRPADVYRQESSGLIP
jgi:hypothetical protein